jgi:hypothetical protein
MLPLCVGGCRGRTGTLPNGQAFNPDGQKLLEKTDQRGNHPFALATRMGKSRVAICLEPMRTFVAR